MTSTTTPTQYVRYITTGGKIMLHVAGCKGLNRIVHGSNSLKVLSDEDAEKELKYATRCKKCFPVGQ